MTDAIINAARKHWGLGAAAVTLIAARENRVYRVDGADGLAALRLHRPDYRSATELWSELQWMAMLGQSGIHVPAPIAAPDGTYLLEQGGTAVDLLTWLEGAPLSAARVTPEIYHALGRLTAQMQNCADAWQMPHGFTRPTWDLAGEQPSWGPFCDNPHLTEDQRALFTTFRDTARTALAALEAPDMGLIHADLVPDNVLLHEGQLYPIDFDDGGFGHRLFDLATVTFRSRRTDPTGALADAAIAGYSANRPLDCAALPLFEALRACSYMGWNMTRLEEDGAQDRNSRFIREAVQSVRRYLQSRLG